jgi:aryl-alcohol dehydrogenase-like predicted oxidoreductase
VARVRAFKALANDLGSHPVTLAISWCLNRGPHLIPIPGTRSAEHLAECAAASDFPMTPEIMARIETTLPVGWAHGDRYTTQQWIGPEGYC